jgi:hypothetical protein
MFVKRKYVVVVIEEDSDIPLTAWLQSTVRVETIYEVPEGYRVQLVKEADDEHETVD